MENQDPGESSDNTWRTYLNLIQHSSQQKSHTEPNTNVKPNLDTIMRRVTEQMFAVPHDPNADTSDEDCLPSDPVRADPLNACTLASCFHNGTRSSQAFCSAQQCSKTNDASPCAQCLNVMAYEKYGYVDPSTVSSFNELNTNNKVSILALPTVSSTRRTAVPVQSTSHMETLVEPVGQLRMPTQSIGQMETPAEYESTDLEEDTDEEIDVEFDSDQQDVLQYSKPTIQRTRSSSPSRSFQLVRPRMARTVPSNNVPFPNAPRNAPAHVPALSRTTAAPRQPHPRHQNAVQRQPHSRYQDTVQRQPNSRHQNTVRRQPHPRHQDTVQRQPNSRHQDTLNLLKSSAVKHKKSANVDLNLVKDAQRPTTSSARRHYGRNASPYSIGNRSGSQNSETEKSKHAISSKNDRIHHKILFSNLHSVIPAIQNQERIPQYKVLEKAYSHIKALQDEYDQLQAERKKEQERKQRLRERIKHLQ